MPKRSIVLLSALALLAAGCGGGNDPDPQGSGSDVPAIPLPAECTGLPFTMRLEAGGDAPAGDAEFEVADAVARRVAILPGLATTSDAGELEQREQRAAETSLAVYSVYLSDAPIDRTQLEQFGFGLVTPAPGTVIGTLSIVPAEEPGFAEGDIADGEGERGYTTTTTFSEVQLTVVSGDDPDAVQAYETVEGRVEILAVNDQALCLEVDLEFLRGGEMVTAAKGIITAEVVRAPNSFYFT